MFDCMYHSTQEQHTGQGSEHVTQQRHYLLEYPTSGSCIIMHTPATLFLTKEPIQPGCQAIIVIIFCTCTLCCSSPLATALPLRKCPLAAHGLGWSLFSFSSPSGQLTQDSAGSIMHFYITSTVMHIVSTMLVCVAASQAYTATVVCFCRLLSAHDEKQLLVMPGQQDCQACNAWGPAVTFLTPTCQG